MLWGQSRLLATLSEPVLAQQNRRDGCHPYQCPPCPGPACLAGCPRWLAWYLRRYNGPCQDRLKMPTIVRIIAPLLLQPFPSSPPRLASSATLPGVCSLPVAFLLVMGQGGGEALRSCPCMPLPLRRSVIPLMHSYPKGSIMYPLRCVPEHPWWDWVHTGAQEPDLTLKSWCRDAALLEQNTRLALDPCVSLPDPGALLLQGGSPPFPCAPSRGRHRGRRAGKEQAREGVHLPT